GSPLDGAVFFSLQLAGLFVLLRRHVSLSKVASENIAMTLFLAFGALSILWSDFPLVAFKRWFKVLGHPIMVLIVATEPDPRQALRSEEHTSELQSRFDLVCRLLLEKKKQN